MVRVHKTGTVIREKDRILKHVHRGKEQHPSEASDDVILSGSRAPNIPVLLFASGS